MDIDDADHRGSTALHWACFAKAEFALSYILSMNPDLEYEDNVGNTPLHLAIKSVAQLESTRPVRALLLRGADRKAVNKKKQTCMEITRSCDIRPNLLRELEGMLQEPKYLECFMVRAPLVPLRKNHKTQCLFVLLFCFILLTQVVIILPAQRSPIMAYLVTLGSFVLSITFFTASVKDPGYLRPAHKFLHLLTNVHACEMCPDCQVMRSNRSKHCAICNRCVERFDHHCPWINNCVGVNNHNAYVGFIYSLCITLVLITISCCISFGEEAW